MFWKKEAPRKPILEDERAAIWMDGFAAGVSKSWDSLIPVMAGNIEALKKKIHEDATLEALKRLNGKR